MNAAKGALKVRCRINQSFHYHHQPKTWRVGVCQTVLTEGGKSPLPLRKCQRLVLGSGESVPLPRHLRHREIDFSLPNSTGSSQL